MLHRRPHTGLKGTGEMSGFSWTGGGLISLATVAQSSGGMYGEGVPTGKSHDCLNRPCAKKNRGI
jgi:hypothetical protein